jgi:hypothetical protein
VGIEVFSVPEAGSGEGDIAGTAFAAAEVPEQVGRSHTTILEGLEVFRSFV